MKALLSILTGLGLTWTLWGQESVPSARLNTLGYLPEARKVATVAASAERFTVVRERDGVVMLEGTLGEGRPHGTNGARLRTADFSGLVEPGEYRLRLESGEASPVFRVGNDVYREAYRTVMRGFHLWRCGTAVRGEHGGDVFAHGACHLDDARLDVVGRPGERRDATGGWHDAGDYNKYVVNAGVTVGVLLRAWEDFGPAIRGIRPGGPESGGHWPEFLSEVRWEIDWLHKMQADDGQVYHKVSTREFGGMILPDRETADRYFAPPSTAATASFVAMMAQASRVFRPYDAAAAERCLEAARRSYAHLKAHPHNVHADQSAFRTGTYQTSDDDDRLWAAAELWETTGDEEVLKDLESRLREAGVRVQDEFDWGSVGNLGIFTYLRSSRAGRDEDLVQEFRDDVLRAADRIVATRDAHAYGRTMGDRYYWGCNGTVARQSVILHAAYRVSARRVYRETALDTVHHLFGRNAYGRSFVTGLGDRPPMRPHDRRSAGDDVRAPWPGYLVGGAHPGEADWRDAQDDYRTNEIAINWNAALVYALAGFVDGAAGWRVEGPPPARRPDVVFVPTPGAVVERMLELAEIRPGDVVYDLGCGDGRIVVEAAKRYGVRAEGFDIDPDRVREARENVRTNGVGHLVTIHQADIFTLDLRPANVVMLYLLPQLNVRLMPQLRELRPGSRILSHDFDMRGARPVLRETVEVKDTGTGELFFGPREHTIYLWRVPWEPAE